MFILKIVMFVAVCFKFCSFLCIIFFYFFYLQIPRERKQYIYEFVLEIFFHFVGSFHFKKEPENNMHGATFYMIIASICWICRRYCCCISYYSLLYKLFFVAIAINCDEVQNVSYIIFSARETKEQYTTKVARQQQHQKNSICFLLFYFLFSFFFIYLAIKRGIKNNNLFERNCARCFIRFFPTYIYVYPIYTSFPHRLLMASSQLLLIADNGKPGQFNCVTINSNFKLFLEQLEASLQI